MGTRLPSSRGQGDARSPSVPCSSSSTIAGKGRGERVCVGGLLLQPDRVHLPIHQSHHFRIGPQFLLQSEDFFNFFFFLLFPPSPSGFWELETSSLDCSRICPNLPSTLHCIKENRASHRLYCTDGGRGSARHSPLQLMLPYL